MIGVLIKEENNWFIKTTDNKYKVNIYHYSLASTLNSYLPPNTEIRFDLVLGESQGAFIKEKV